jgi:hypothetical protein
MYFKLHSFLLSFFFLVLGLLPNLYRCRGLLLQLVIISNTYTLGETPLDKGSALRRDLPYLRNTKHSNPQSQQASGRRPTHWTAQLLGSTVSNSTLTVSISFDWSHKFSGREFLK